MFKFLKFEQNLSAVAAVQHDVEGLIFALLVAVDDVRNLPRGELALLRREAAEHGGGLRAVLLHGVKILSVRGVIKEDHLG